MSDDQRQGQFETEQLAAFLDNIAREETRERERLTCEYKTRERAVRTDARRRSRQYHRQVAEQTRARLESEHMREVSRARNELRRRRWEALRELRARARDRIWNHLRERWLQPDRQLSWCRYWLEHCERLESCDEIEIVLGRGTHENTADGIRRWIAEGDRSATVTVDESIGEGILVRRGERSIDGLLLTQLDHLSQLIHGELAGWLHEPDTGEDDEQ